MEQVIIAGTIEGKRFENINAVYSGGPLNLKDCDFEGCEFTVGGAAADGVAFMKALFESGGRRTVLRTFLSEEEYEVAAKALGWKDE